MSHPSQSDIRTTTTTKHYTTQAKKKKSYFCFIGSEAEAYDVISDAEEMFYFVLFFYIGFECDHVDE